MKQLKTFWRDETGATAIEYAIIVSMIFLAIVAAVRGFTTNASNMYNTLSTTMTNA